jgi:hypothetical protein
LQWVTAIPFCVLCNWQIWILPRCFSFFFFQGVIGRLDSSFDYVKL